MYDFNYKELTALEMSIYSIQKNVPALSKKFMRAEALKLKKLTLKKAKSSVNQKTGNYFKSIKSGKVYYYGTNKILSIRVYSGASHAHLIEDGYKTNGTKVSGKKILEKSAESFETTFNNDLGDFILDTIGDL